MLRWILTFLIVALIASVPGFTGIAGVAAEIARLLSFIFLVLFVVALLPAPSAENHRREAAPFPHSPTHRSLAAMKNQFTALLALVATTSLLAGRSDRAKKDSDPIVSSAAATHSAPSAAATAPGTPAPEPSVPVAPATATMPDPFANIAIALDETTRDTTARLSSLQDNMNKAIDGQIAAWKAAGATSTTMADEKLALARTDFTQKLRNLSLQGDETWKNAKGAAQISLQNLRRVYTDYMSVPAKN